MKKIEAYVRPEAFDPIREDLLARGFPSLTITEVRGAGRQEGVVEHHLGTPVLVNVRPKLKIEIVVADRDKSMVLETILRHARTGEVGDGKIFVSTIDEAFRIRTGEEGDEILDAHAPWEIPA